MGRSLLHSWQLGQTAARSFLSKLFNYVSIKTVTSLSGYHGLGVPGIVHSRKPDVSFLLTATSHCFLWLQIKIALSQQRGTQSYRPLWPAHIERAARLQLSAGANRLAHFVSCVHHETVFIRLSGRHSARSTHNHRCGDQPSSPCFHMHPSFLTLSCSFPKILCQYHTKRTQGKSYVFII